MQDHPVPQNITSYEFHLIGNMTLKQFMELALGGGIAFLVYSSNLPAIFKYPVVLMFVGLGIAMAFLPIQERPLDTWFLAFIRAIYNPTKFHWKKTIKVPDIFGYAQKKLPVGPTDIDTLTQAQRESRVAAYFQSISSSATVDTDPEDILQKALNIMQIYDSVPAAKDVLPTAHSTQNDVVEKPSLTVKPHQLTAQKTGTSGTITMPAGSQKATENIALPTVLASQNLVTKGPVVVGDAGKAPLAVTRNIVEEQAALAKKSAAQEYRSEQAVAQTTTDTNIEEVQKSKSLPFPKTPTTPNVVVGMVLDKDGKILENAIVEIRTIQGFPARALKSNRLGQFFASTPLPTGEYEIIVEKEGHTFAPQKLSITNKVVAPLDIRSS